MFNFPKLTKVSTINYGKNSFPANYISKKAINGELNICSKCLNFFEYKNDLHLHFDSCKVPFVPIYSEEDDYIIQDDIITNIEQNDNLIKSNDDKNAEQNDIIKNVKENEILKDDNLIKNNLKNAEQNNKNKRINFAKINSLVENGLSLIQRLSLIGSNFIENKTVNIDLVDYDFYIIFSDEIMGYFSRKRIMSSSLSCISVFPPFQRLGLGTLLIDFSQFTNKNNNKLVYSDNNRLYTINGPERPLTKKAIFCYRKYWKYLVIGAKSINEISSKTNLSVEEVIIGLERNGFNFNEWKIEFNEIKKPRLLKYKPKIIE